MNEVTIILEGGEDTINTSIEVVNRMQTLKDEIQNFGDLSTVIALVSKDVMTVVIEFAEEDLKLLPDTDLNVSWSVDSIPVDLGLVLIAFNGLVPELIQAASYLNYPALQTCLNKYVARMIKDMSPVEIRSFLLQKKSKPDVDLQLKVKEQLAWHESNR